MLNRDQNSILLHGTVCVKIGHNFDLDLEPRIVEAKLFVVKLQ